MEPPPPYMPYWLPAPHAFYYGVLVRRIEELEEGFGFVCEALAKLAAELGSTSNGPVSTKLRSFDAAAYAVAASAAMQEVAALVKAERLPAAARRYRELAGVTWDAAHFTIDHRNDAPGAAERCARTIASQRRLEFLRDLAKTTP